MSQRKGKNRGNNRLRVRTPRFGSKTVTKTPSLSSRTYCPWDTIRMVPTSAVAGHQTSLDSQVPGMMNPK